MICLVVVVVVVGFSVVELIVVFITEDGLCLKVVNEGLYIPNVHAH